MAVRLVDCYKAVEDYDAKHVLYLSRFWSNFVHRTLRAHPSNNDVNILFPKGTQLAGPIARCQAAN